MDKNEYLNIFEHYLSGRASSDEIEHLRSFINSDKQLSNWLENQMMESPDDIDRHLKLRMFENIKSNITLQEPTKDRKRFSLQRISAIAAAIFLPIILAVSIYMYVNITNNEAEPLKIIAEYGEKAHVTLPDGSKIMLNSDSKIMYFNDYNIKQRFLKLDGEAYFEVKPNHKIPFIVECLDLKIKVLGTTFGIRAYDNDDVLSVILNTGKIEMTTPTETLIMKPNDRIVYNRKTKQTLLSTVDANDYTGWRYNRLHFENESLEDIVVTLSRMHNVDIIFEDQYLKDLKYTGTINNTNIESVLKTISLTSPVTYKIKDGVIVLFENKQSKRHFN